MQADYLKDQLEYANKTKQTQDKVIELELTLKDVEIGFYRYGLNYTSSCQNSESETSPETVREIELLKESLMLVQNKLIELEDKCNSISIPIEGTTIPSSS